VAILVDVLTDNRNRTAGEVRKIFERGGGNMGSAGCVGYLFERKGILSVSTDATDEDTLMGIALDAGADDMKQSGNTFDITCDPHHFNAVQEALQKAAIPTVNAEITQLPKTSVDAPDMEATRKVIKLVEMLDEHDDVQHVHSNLHMSEAVVAELEKA
jgi:YebC/PmpR family DNA-binding regulatory protein